MIFKINRHDAEAARSAKHAISFLKKFGLAHHTLLCCASLKKLYHKAKQKAILHERNHGNQFYTQSPLHFVCVNILITHLLSLRTMVIEDFKSLLNGGT
jgi:hypothetical protein